MVLVARRVHWRRPAIKSDTDNMNVTASCACGAAFRCGVRPTPRLWRAPRSNTRASSSRADGRYVGRRTFVRCTWHSMRSSPRMVLCRRFDWKASTDAISSPSPRILFVVDVCSSCSSAASACLRLTWHSMQFKTEPNFVPNRSRGMQTTSGVPSLDLPHPHCAAAAALPTI